MENKDPAVSLNVLPLSYKTTPFSHKQKKKRKKNNTAIVSHSEQINQVNNYLQKIGQWKKSTLPQQVAIPGLLGCQDLSIISYMGTMENMGKSMFTCALSCSFLCCVPDSCQ